MKTTNSFSKHTVKLETWNIFTQMHLPIQMLLSHQDFLLCSRKKHIAMLLKCAVHHYVGFAMCGIIETSCRKLCSRRSLSSVRVCSLSVRLILCVCSTAAFLHVKGRKGEHDCDSVLPSYKQLWLLQTHIQFLMGRNTKQFFQQ